MEIGLLLLRVAVGATLAAHGAQKLFGWFGGPGLEATGRGFEAIGFQPGQRHAFMAGLTEIAGGVFLALGFLTPVAASIVFAVMLVAAVSVHVQKGFFLATGGFEYNFILGVAGLTVAFTGPGAVSIDALLGWQLAGASWGAAALVVGLLGGAAQLANRRPSLAIPAVQ